MTARSRRSFEQKYHLETSPRNISLSLRNVSMVPLNLFHRIRTTVVNTCRREEGSDLFLVNTTCFAFHFSRSPIRLCNFDGTLATIRLIH
jgi:hypothetical protein